MNANEIEMTTLTTATEENNSTTTEEKSDMNKVNAKKVDEIIKDEKVGELLKKVVENKNIKASDITISDATKTKTQSTIEKINKNTTDKTTIENKTNNSLTTENKSTHTSNYSKSSYSSKTYSNYSAYSSYPESKEVHIFSKVLPKFFETIIRLPQKELKSFLVEYLRHKGYENVIVKDGFIYAEGDAPVLCISHMDTVHAKDVEEIYVSNFGNISSPQGIGGDDRCGIYMISNLIESHKPHILFTEDEEIGCVGAKKFVTYHSCHKSLFKVLHTIKCILEFDRKGNNDAVYYDCDNLDFERFITSFGLTTQHGSCSDISYVAPALGVAAVNISSAYYQPHTVNEIINIDELITNVNIAKKIISSLKMKALKAFKYVPKKTKYSGSYWGNYDYDYDDYFLTNKNKKDEFDEEEETTNSYAIDFSENNNFGFPRSFALSDNVIGGDAIRYSYVNNLIMLRVIPFTGLRKVYLKAPKTNKTLYYSYEVDKSLVIAPDDNVYKYDETTSTLVLTDYSLYLTCNDEPCLFESLMGEKFWCVTELIEIANLADTPLMEFAYKQDDEFYECTNAPITSTHLDEAIDSIEDMEKIVDSETARN